MPESYYLHLSKTQYMERWQEFKDFFQDDELEVVQRPMRDTLKKFLQGLMQVEQTAQVGARRHKRSCGRTDRRNGYYKRNLLTAFGMVRELLVPRLRKGGLRTKVFVRYRRRRKCKRRPQASAKVGRPAA